MKNAPNTTLKYTVRIRNDKDKNGGYADVYYTDSLAAAKRFRTQLVKAMPNMVCFYILDDEMNCLSVNNGAM